MEFIINDYPEFQRKPKPSLMELNEKSEVIVPGFIGNNAIEAERMRRVRVLAETNEWEYHPACYALASNMLFCNNHQPCYRPPCAQCNRTRQLEYMHHYMKHIDNEYIAISIDLNKETSKIPNMLTYGSNNIRNIRSRLNSLFNSVNCDGLIVGVLTIEHHSFADDLLSGYCIPQLKFLIKNDNDAIKRLEKYVMNSGNIYICGSILNPPLRKYKFDSVEALTAYVFDLTWYERQCIITKENVLLKGKEIQLNARVLYYYLLYQDMVRIKNIRFFYDKKKN